MSFEAVAIAMNHSRATGAARLILVGIASHDGDGGAWPAVSTLARYANVTPRAVQKAVAQLEALREVRRHIQKGGTALTADHARPNLYEFILMCPPDCDRTKNHRTRRHAGPNSLTRERQRGVNPTTGDEPQGIPPVNPRTDELPMNLPSTSKKRTYVPERARGACGHELIDERHCEIGCRIEAVQGVLA